MPAVPAGSLAPFPAAPLIAPPASGPDAAGAAVDLPVIIVNHTRHTQSMLALSEAGKRHVAARLRSHIACDVEAVCEAFFENDHACHSSTTRCHRDLAKLEAAHPNESFVVVDMPATVHGAFARLCLDAPWRALACPVVPWRADPFSLPASHCPTTGVPLREMWQHVTRPSRWRSVSFMKLLIAGCNRNLVRA